MTINNENLGGFQSFPSMYERKGMQGNEKNLIYNTNGVIFFILQQDDVVRRVLFLSKKSHS
jgi:hypothetical protein